MTAFIRINLKNHRGESISIINKVNHSVNNSVKKSPGGQQAEEVKTPLELQVTIFLRLCDKHEAILQRL